MAIKEQKEYAGEHDYDPTTGAKNNLEQYDAFASVKPNVWAGNDWGLKRGS